MRKLSLRSLLFLIILCLITTHSSADMNIDVPATYGTKGAIVTLDCTIQCSDLDATNFYICFNPNEMRYLGLYLDQTDIVEEQSGFVITSNAQNVDAVNSQGMIGVVIHDQTQQAAKTYFQNGVCLLTMQFILLTNTENDQYLSFVGDNTRIATALSNGQTSEVTFETHSGFIARLSPADSTRVLALPPSLTRIEPDAFYDCDFIQTVKAEEGLTFIGEQAFAECSILRDIYLPESIQTIEDNAFKNSSEIIIHCFEDSLAQEYAHTHRIPYILSDKAEVDTTITTGD